MHLNAETVFDLMDGRLDETLAHQWTEHIASCSTCSGEMSQWQELRRTLKRTHLESAPRALLASAATLFRPKRSVPEIIATLIFDSFAQPAFAGARGESGTRQVVMSAGDYDIHLQIGPSTANREMLGQIQPRGNRLFVESARLHLLQHGVPVSSTQINDLGEFYFKYVPEGFVNLQVDLPHLTVVGALDITDKY